MHVDWLRDYGSRDDVIEMFEALDAPLRHEVLAAQPRHWYRFATLVDLHAAICGQFAHGDPRFVERIGAYAAQKQLVPLRRYVSHDHIHDFFRTTATLHHEGMDFGDAEYEWLGEHRGRMTVTELGEAPSHRAFLAGFYRESIAQHGARDPEVEESIPGTFELCWR